MKIRPALGYVLLAAILLLAVAGVKVWYVRPGLAAYDAHRYAPPQQERGGLTATWLGNTAVLLRDGDNAIMVDPFFSRPPGLLPLLRNAEIAPDEQLIARWLNQLEVTRLDAVLVSHSHYDHAMDAGVVARLTGAVLVGSETTANIGRGSGMSEASIRVVGESEAVELGPFSVTFILSRHASATGGRPTGNLTSPLVPPARYGDYRQGDTYSILIRHRAGNVLHHGSAGFVPGALNGYRADVVFLGIAAGTDLAEYLANVVDAVGAKRVIPVHWDDFTRPLDQPAIPLLLGVDLDGFLWTMDRDRPNVAVQTLFVGEPAPLFTGSL